MKYLYRTKSRYNGEKADETEKILKILELDSNDASDILGSGSSLLRFEGQRVFITYEGGIFMENYRYNELKEYAFWVFGLLAVIAAIFSVVVTYK